MEIKAVIFDIDGTLVTTDRQYRTSVVRGALDGLGVTPHPTDIDGFWFGRYAPNDIEDAVGVSADTFWSAFNAEDDLEDRMEATRPFDDVGVIDSLVKRGVRIGALSDARPSVVYANLEKIGRDYFAAVVITHPQEGLPPKPDPTGLLACLNRLGVEPHEALYVGNSAVDATTARNAGVRDVIVERDEYPVQATPSIRVRSLYDLLDLTYQKTQENTACKEVTQWQA